MLIIVGHVDIFNAESIENNYLYYLYFLRPLNVLHSPSFIIIGGVLSLSLSSHNDYSLFTLTSN